MEGNFSGAGVGRGRQEAEPLTSCCVAHSIDGTNVAKCSLLDLVVGIQGFLIVYFSVFLHIFIIKS